MPNLKLNQGYDMDVIKNFLKDSVKVEKEEEYSLDDIVKMACKSIAECENPVIVLFALSKNFDRKNIDRKMGGSKRNKKKKKKNKKKTKYLRKSKRKRVLSRNKKHGGSDRYPNDGSNEKPYEKQLMELEEARRRTDQTRLELELTLNDSENFDLFIRIFGILLFIGYLIINSTA